jgi:tetratricopeptide (TPR) repeat protein
MPPEPAVAGQTLARGEPPTLRTARGRPLADAIAAHRRSPSPLGLHDLLRPFAAACYEIAYAHSRGATHLGLTPRLVLLGEFGESAVIGWDRAGLTPSANGAPQPDEPDEPDAYTAAFLAPEQAAGAEGEVGPAADVYALGAILHAILTGQPPYVEATAAEVRTRVREGLAWQPRMVAAGVPAALEGVCLTAMERAPADRYKSAAELAREVERWMAGQRVRTNYVEPKGARLWRWLRSRYGLFTLIGLLAASLICLAVAINVIRVERGYMAKDTGQLAEAARRAKEHFDEVHQQRAFASAEFAATIQTLRALASRAEAPSEAGATLPAFKEDLLQSIRDAAHFLAQRADQGNGNDLPAARDRANLAELFRTLHENDAARRQYERALAIARLAVKAQPDNLIAQRELLAAARGLGQLCLLAGQPSFARNLAHEAQTAADVLAKAEPNNSNVRHDEATCFDLMASACVALHDLPTAREAFVRMTTTVEGYARAEPNNVSWQLDLANTYIDRGKIERLDHQFEAAVSWYDRGIVILRQLKGGGKLKPPQIAYLDEVEKMANECRDILKAVEDVNFALKERGGETTLRLLTGRAEALARQGRLADATATIETMRGLKPQDGPNLYNVACCYALCVPAVGAGKSDSDLTAEEKAARANYAARAVKELRAAADHGFRYVEKIETDLDLDALHGEAGYRALVAELKALRQWIIFPVLP